MRLLPGSLPAESREEELPEASVRDSRLGRPSERPAGGGLCAGGSPG